MQQNNGGNGPWQMDTLVRYDYDSNTGECSELQIIKFSPQNQGVIVYDRETCQVIRPFLNQLSTEQFLACTTSLNGIKQALMTRSAALDYPFGAEDVPSPFFNNLYAFNDFNDFTAVASVITSCRNHLLGAVGSDGAGGTDPAKETR
jgi:hypothetical protein